MFGRNVKFLFKLIKIPGVIYWGCICISLINKFYQGFIKHAS